MTTIDRLEWIKARIEFLESRRDMVTDEERAAIDSELEALRREGRGGRLTRWLTGLAHLPR
jgi:hypothetical protein